MFLLLLIQWQSQPHYDPFVWFFGTSSPTPVLCARAALCWVLGAVWLGLALGSLWYRWSDRQEFVDRDESLAGEVAAHLQRAPNSGHMIAMADGQGPGRLNINVPKSS